MRKLIAIFNIELSSELLIKRGEVEELNYKTRIEGFDVNIFLISKGSRIKRNNERYSTYPIHEVKITVARDESIEPPPILTEKDGTRDYTQQVPYFQERLPIYREIAATVLNRLISFFKYKLQNPRLENISEKHHSLQKPKWTNETGEEVGKGGYLFYVSGFPSIKSLSFGAKRLTPKDDQRLVNFLKNPLKPQLYQEILSDAQNAILENNYRRAVLEMAIACEIAIKETYFKKSSLASAVYEHLEDKGSINIRLVNLIDKVAKDALGASFRELYENEFRNIDFLFRCRNKIAHRGKPVFRDDTGTRHFVNEQILIEWWKSVEILFKWLKKYRNR